MEATALFTVFLTQYYNIECVIHDYICALNDANAANAAEAAVEAAKAAAKAASKKQMPDEHSLWTQKLMSTWDGLKLVSYRKVSLFNDDCYKIRIALYKLLKSIGEEAAKNPDIAMAARRSIYSKAILDNYEVNTFRIKANSNIANKELSAANIAFCKAQKEYENVYANGFTQSGEQDGRHFDYTDCYNKGYANESQDNARNAYLFAIQFAEYTADGVRIGIPPNHSCVESYV
jgi:hypothetical protein